MKILMIAPEPFLEPRGTPISVYRRILGLTSLGHKVDLVTYHRGRDIAIPGMVIHRIPSVPFIKEIKVGPSWYKPLLDLLLLWKAIALLIRKRYDVIHSHEEAAFFAMFLSSLFRTPHLYDMHSSLPRQLANFKTGNYRPIVKLFEMLERRTINTCNAIITIGPDLEQHVRRINPAANHVMIENIPVEEDAADIDQGAVDRFKEALGLRNRPLIVYTGTFEHYQGIDLLIDSAQIAKEHCPDVAFLLVGGKSHQIEHWKGHIRKLGLQDQVYLVGTVPLEEASMYLRAADILVSPRTAGTSVPLKIYSYLLSGKPIVATGIPAHTLVLNDDTAVLVEPSKGALAEGLLKLVHSADLREQFGSRAQKYAREQYSPAVYLAKLDQVYRPLQPVESALEQSAAR